MKQGAAKKKPRKARSRSTRGKHDVPRRFGIRYLHHHMFTDKQLCPYECKCGSTMASIYSGKTLVAMTASILILLIGITFMLVGYLIPRRPVVYLEKADGSRTPVDHSAITFNTMLDDFTLVGTVLVSLGALMFCLVLVIPVCRTSNRRGEYSKAPTEEIHAVSKSKSTEGPRPADTTSSSSTIQKIPVLALVHGDIQQAEHKRPSGSRREKPKRKAEKFRESFEEED